jgi:hypothetical protein
MQGIGRILDSKKYRIWLLALILFSFLANFILWRVSPTIDRKESEKRGETVYTLEFSFFGKTTYGPWDSPLPEGLSFRTEEGKILTPQEMVLVINPALHPFVKDGKVYTRTPGWSRWGIKTYYEAPVNPVTTRVANALRSIPGKD